MPLKIWLGLSEIAGFFQRLKGGFEELGHQVDFINMHANPYNYSGGSTSLPQTLIDIVQSEKDRLIIEANIQDQKAHHFYFLKRQFWHFWLKNRKAKSYNIYKFIMHFKKYDCLIFIYGNSFFLKSGLVRFNDLFWLKLFRIKVIFLMCGSDSRPTFLDYALLNAYEDQSVANILKTTQETKLNNQFIEKYATFVVSNIFSSYFFYKPIIPLQTVGSPCVDIISNDNIAPISLPNFSKTIKIMHAPSSPDAKGTSEITKIINELIKEGVDIDFTVLTNVPHQKIIEHLQQCDFVIDQLYSDIAFASFATEAASYKKAVIVGTYLTKEELQESYKILGMPPTYICHPNQLKEAILTLVQDPQLRNTLGNAAYEYVSKQFSPRQVASRYIQLIKGIYPKIWRVNAQPYIKQLPVCFSEERMQSILQTIADAGYSDCLELQTKPISPLQRLIRSCKKITNLFYKQTKLSQSKSSS